MVTTFTTIPSHHMYVLFIFTRAKFNGAAYLQLCFVPSCKGQTVRLQVLGRFQYQSVSIFSFYYHSFFDLTAPACPFCCSFFSTSLVTLKKKKKTSKLINDFHLTTTTWSPYVTSLFPLTSRVATGRLQTSAFVWVRASFTGNNCRSVTTHQAHQLVRLSYLLKY